MVTIGGGVVAYNILLPSFPNMKSQLILFFGTLLPRAFLFKVLHTNHKRNQFKNEGEKKRREEGDRKSNVLVVSQFMVLHFTTTVTTSSSR